MILWHEGHALKRGSGYVWPEREKFVRFQHLITDPVFLAFIVFILCLILVILTTEGLYGYSLDFFRNIVVEAHGMLMDILIIGVFILWLNKKAERRLENKRYQEEIDDLKAWRSEEAKYKIKGNIRRLIKNGAARIDLSRCLFKKVDFSELDLQKAFLLGADLEDANLGKSDFRGANFTSTNLQRALLIGTNLQNALFFWSDLENATLWSADVTDAKFVNSYLRNTHITVEQLSKAKTLFDSRLDSNVEEEIKNKYPYLLEKPTWIEEHESYPWEESKKKEAERRKKGLI